MSSDTQWMQQAIDAALRGPEADANPRVGCVVVDAHGDLVATGWHRGAGTPHAEADALMHARERVRGATAYVTPEPCNHTGRTGPCTQALLDAGVREVVYAVPDPSALAGGGGAWLAERGLTVRSGALAEEAAAVTASWAHFQRTGRPWVVWKTAMTLDGRSAAGDGTSQWITGEAAREDVHRERARCGAVIVGTGTALSDAPRLTVRLADYAGPQPVRVVVGGRHTPDLPAEPAVPVLRIPSHDRDEVLRALGEKGIHRVMLEGGPTLAAAFLRAGAVDEVLAYVAPALLGAGRSAVDDLGITTIDEAMRFGVHEIAQVGDDVRFRLRVQGQVAEGMRGSREMACAATGMGEV
ncbi:MAG: bifunctional diaminohydroxyphosphoribosylaminopyrimidine deaminase/5-amino-6-(5-phosphoribosylamino)uracil reductase RibD [Micrococcales bacterium]|nr:bifunctional diaminohydroxyphosphoribosylaminopyrimidine deaminase/5-amino-6-(5-phosphoribosylamino)uracil reductase RibD [Micrococcales bacterium]